MYLHKKAIVKNRESLFPSLFIEKNSAIYYREKNKSMMEQFQF